MMKTNNWKKRKLSVLLMVVMVFYLAPLAGMTEPVNATTRTVTSTDDTSNPGTLRTAIFQSQNGDIVNISPELAGHTIELTVSPFITENITINGNGINISGKNQRKIFNVVNCDVTLNDIIFSNGGNTEAIYGGGINNENGSLTINDCIFRNNTAIYGGAIYSQNDETSSNASSNILTNCYFTGNKAVWFGGSVFFDGNGDSIQFINCTFADDNTSDNSGNIFHYAKQIAEPSPQFLNCILANADNGSLFSGSRSGNPTINDVIFKNTLTNNTTLGNNSNNENNIVGRNILGVAINGHLYGYSPAVNAGNNSFFANAEISKDLAGNLRVFGNTIDIGAYEYQGVPTSLAPGKDQLTYDLTSKIYNGKPQGVSVRPKVGVGKVTVKYNGSVNVPVNAGSYAVTVDVAVGSDYVAKPGISLGIFNINKADLSKSNVTVSDMTWIGKQLKPTKFTYNGIGFAIGTNAIVNKYGANKNIGKGSVQLTGKGTNFIGTKTATFKILPKKNSISKIASGKKQMKVNWKKMSAAQKVTKYQVRYRIKGTSKWKTKTYGASKSSATIKKLKKGKRYEVQVRSYKTVSKVKYYSAWSVKKNSKKIK